MARIRTIKPEFFTSEDIVALSPMARLLYIALWCEADREGRLQWKPKTMKLRYFPADQCDVIAMADELVAGGLVVLYEDGELAYIPSFSKHQHINPRESESQLPAPTEKAKKRRASTRDDASARVNDAQGGRGGKGKEGEGKEGVEKPASRTPPCPDGVDPVVWADWLQLRKAKRAPVTVTVIAAAGLEAEKAGLPLSDFLRVWCARGSQGLEAAWLKPNERGVGPPDEPLWRTEQRQRTEAFLGPYAGKRTATVIDIEEVHAVAAKLG